MSPESPPPAVDNLAAQIARAERRLGRSLKAHRLQRLAAVRDVLLPEYARPLPALRLLRFVSCDSPRTLARGALLTPETPPYIPWRTAADCTPWPVSVRAVGVAAGNDLPPDFGASAALRVELVEDEDADAIPNDGPRPLTLFLAAELAEAIDPAPRAAARPLDGKGLWTSVVVRRAASAPDAELWPSPLTLPPGSRRLTENLLFPESAQLFEIRGLEACGTGAGRELLLALARVPDRADRLKPATVVPNVVAAVNLFERVTMLLEPPGPRRSAPVVLRPGEEALDVVAVTAHDPAGGRPTPWPRFGPGGQERWRAWCPAIGSLRFTVRPSARPPRGALELCATAHNGPAAVGEPAGRRLTSDDFTASAELLAVGCGPVAPPAAVSVRSLTAARAWPASDAVLRQRLATAGLVGWRAGDGDRATAARLRQAGAAIAAVRLVSVELDTAASVVPGALFRGRHLTVEVDAARLSGRSAGAFITALDHALADAAPLGLFHRLTVIVQPNGEVYPCKPRFGAALML